MHHLTSPDWRRTAVAALALLLAAPLAWAALGRAPQPTAQAQAATSGVPGVRQLRALPRSSAYSVATTTLPTGTVVREFVNSQQLVFAVVWQGPVKPDLALFFGDHHTAYQQAVVGARAAGQRGGVIQLHRSELVLVSRGRMGHFEGYAYLPAIVPEGVNITTLLP